MKHGLAGVGDIAGADTLIDVRSPSGIRRRPPARGNQLPRARRRRARADRHALQAGITIRSQEARCRARRPQYRTPSGSAVPRPPEALGADHLLLARRPAQRFDGHHLPLDRLERAPARRRLQGLAARGRRRTRRASAAVPLPRALRCHRQRQNRILQAIGALGEQIVDLEALAPATKVRYSVSCRTRRSRRRSISKPRC